MPIHMLDAGRLFLYCTLWKLNGYELECASHILLPTQLVLAIRADLHSEVVVDQHA